MSFTASIASSTLSTAWHFGIGSLSLSMKWPNKSRSSTSLIVWISEPKTLIPSSKPKSPSPVAIFNPVCPPIVGKIASTFSFLIISETISGVNGSV